MFQLVKRELFFFFSTDRSMIRQRQHSFKDESAGTYLAENKNAKIYSKQACGDDLQRKPSLVAALHWP
ncbi:hypothetical protein BpHYR1_009558 [Brachionus plicatilis]|uniref:Uncharacterized protein n=1 Tax=Brachionus plicatilis TaxID=10195 RepID=A0A3M7RDV5_BRAPC|nr:hypothetical protein BpHYR1_009558 [Brachionus plicatilis]